jgi:ketosteroid isomerase-like protein
MRPAAITATIALGWISATAAVEAAGSGTIADTAELTRAACDAGHAYASRDLDALDKLTADDYSQTDVRGVVMQRLAWRDFVRNRKSVLTVECDHVEVRFYGRAAVVTGGWTYTNHKPDGDVITHSRWTSVWTRERDAWKRHAFQNTYVNPEADRCAADAPPPTISGASDGRPGRP